jgi:CHAT domain-containing protein
VLPRLPGTARETREVQAALASVADVTVLQGAAARESAVRKQIAGKRYLHFATHGLVDQEQGELFAALALAPPPPGAPTGDDDGLLQLFEVYDLRLDADLAVLSACGSNAGRVVAGEGIFALSRGFLIAGARRVVASQWPVDDESTAELVGELFRRVAGADNSGGNLDAARALRDAKLRLRRSKSGWAHPFFWAPFVITGVE